MSIFFYFYLFLLRPRERAREREGGRVGESEIDGWVEDGRQEGGGG